MSVPLFFSAKSISMSRRADRKPQSLLQAARHNLRELQAELGGNEHIDMSLSQKNLILHGPNQANEVVELANELKCKYAVPKRKLRKDHVQALEFVVSVRRDTAIDSTAYFVAALRWLIENFTQEMILSAVVHVDEAEQHMHVLVLPIEAGQYQGGVPINRSNLRQLIVRFADEVGKPFGLSFEPRKKLNVQQRKAASALVIKHLEEAVDPVVSSRIWTCIVDSIKFKPQEFIEQLGLQMPVVPNKHMKTSTQIFIGTGRKTTEDRKQRRYQDLSCVGQRVSTAPIAVQESRHGTP